MVFNSVIDSKIYSEFSSLTVDDMFFHFHMASIEVEGEIQFDLIAIKVIGQTSLITTFRKLLCNYFMKKKTIAF